MPLEHFHAKQSPPGVKEMRRKEPEGFSGLLGAENASGGSERLAFLRQRIAGLEAGVGAGEGPDMPCARINLGARRLDRMLRGGLRRGALHEIAPGTRRRWRGGLRLRPRAGGAAQSRRPRPAAPPSSGSSRISPASKAARPMARGSPCMGSIWPASSSSIRPTPRIACGRWRRR